MKNTRKSLKEGLDINIPKDNNLVGKLTEKDTVSLSELRSIVREEILKEMSMSPNKQGSVSSLQKNLRTISNKPMSGVSGGEAANAEQLISSILTQIQTSKQDMTTVLKLLTQKLNQLTSKQG